MPEPSLIYAVMHLIKKRLVFTCCKYSRMLRSGKRTEECSDGEYSALPSILWVFNGTPIHNLYNENIYSSAPTTGILVLEMRQKFPVSANIDSSKSPSRSPTTPSICKARALAARSVKTNKSSDSKKLSHSTKQIDTMLLFPVPSGPLDAHSAQEEAL